MRIRAGDSGSNICGAKCISVCSAKGINISVCGRGYQHLRLGLHQRLRAEGSKISQDTRAQQR